MLIETNNMLFRQRLYVLMLDNVVYIIASARDSLKVAIFGGFFVFMFIFFPIAFMSVTP